MTAALQMRGQCGDAENSIANAVAQIRIGSVSFGLPRLCHGEIVIR